MSFNLSSIFVCGVFFFSIYVDATPSTNFFKQDHLIDALYLPSPTQISDLLNKAMTSHVSKNENNTEGHLCKSVLTTLNDPKQLGMFKVAIVEVLNQIKNQNQDVRQTIISNIFTTLYSCLKRDVAEDDSIIFQKEMRNIINGNKKKVSPSETEIVWKMELDSNPGGTNDTSINLKDDISIDVQNEGVSEENHSGFGYEYISRDLDDVYTYVPHLGFFEEPTGKRKNRLLKHEQMDYMYSGGEIGNVDKPTSKGKSIGNKFFLFDNGLETPKKPIFDEDVGKKIFLFNGQPFDSPETPFVDNKKNKGKKSFFLFDNDLPSNDFVSPKKRDPIFDLLSKFLGEGKKSR